MTSITYGEVDMPKIVELIDKFVSRNPNSDYHVIVGTDSQNFDHTKIVLVIAVIQPSKGGIFFYEVTRIRKITNIREKLYKETQMSLDCANELLEEFEKYAEKTGFDMSKMNFAIHVDAGYNGKTRDVIPEIVGWVTSCGYDVEVKPNSFVASSIADKYSK